MAAHVSVHLRPVKSIRIRIRPVRKYSGFCRLRSGFWDPNYWCFWRPLPDSNRCCRRERG